MSSRLDVTAPVRLLAEAAALIVRLLTARSPQPVHAAVLVRGDGDEVALTATDGMLTARVSVPATVHTPGDVLVSRRGLADTVSGLPSPEARLVAEGARLAVKVPGGRFALPVLGDAWPSVTALPDETLRVDGALVRTAATAVAGAASREHALPIFTGVRVRGSGAGLSLLATDRYRLAASSVPLASCSSPAPFAALVPASLLARIGPVLGRAGSVGVHVGGDVFGLSWAGGSVVTPTLGDAYPDAQFERLLEVAPECVVELEADALRAAAERAGAYAGEHGRVTLQTIEGAVLVRAADPLRGESEEAVKAVVRSGQAVRAYQARLLADALQAFSGEVVSLGIQGGLRATEVRSGGSELRYLIVPMRAPDQQP
ncbi:hypothetical protein [Dactylosporangium sp. NPDC051541]|uniref:DNA polymerase III subunit beta family protein n=1 Tax=Dactylosporangium sp. NPDC051541 TaxID=3363977 RepID=UPI0037B76BE3